MHRGLKQLRAASVPPGDSFQEPDSLQFLAAKRLTRRLNGLSLGAQARAGGGADRRDRVLGYPFERHPGVLLSTRLLY